MSVKARHKPKTSGYAETRPNAATARDQPDPDAAGNERAQVAASHKLPDEDGLEPEDEDTPPGEHKREPIKDPDPADTKLHVQQGSH
jgi:hypothetical protein